MSETFSPRFVIIAHRSAASVCGAAIAVCKNADGSPEYYETREEAQAVATRRNERLVSRNVFYTVDAEF